jgi:hypothetical protein
METEALTTHYQNLGEVLFPSPRDRMANMMPVIVGDIDSLPEDLAGYLPMLQRCGFEPGTTAYLTINESLVEQGATQRRPGIHTDGTAMHTHGGTGPTHGGGVSTESPYREGMCMASTDGATRLWDTLDFDGGRLGELQEPGESSISLRPSQLYWMTDRTPHEGITATTTAYRQFFRLTAHDLGVWYSQHNTQNPLGVPPGCPISHQNKFDA